MGKAGEQMIPFLNAGSAAIAEASAEADRFGLTLTGPAAEGAMTFNDNLDRMTGFVQGVSQQVVSAFLPAVNEMIDRFIATADAGSVANSIIEGIGVVIREVTRFVIEASAAWQELLRWTDAVGESMDALGNGDFSGALDAFKKASADVDAIWAGVAAKVATVGQSVNYIGKGSLPGTGGGGGGGGLDDAPAFTRGEPKKPKRQPVDKLAQEAKRLFEATRSPMEAYNLRVAELSGLLNKGYISQDTFNRALHQSQADMVSATSALNTFVAEANPAFDALAEISTVIEDRFTGMFDSLIDGTTSFKDAFTDMAKGILQDAIKLFAHNAIKSMFAPSNPLYGGGGGFFSQLFDGFFSGGGQIGAGKFGIVGEGGGKQHAEIVTGPATVTPVSKLSGNPMTVTYAPVYQISGSADEGVIRRLQKEALRDFEARLPSIIAKKSRAGAI
jgi:hypothetical protein